MYVAAKKILQTELKHFMAFCCYRFVVMVCYMKVKTDTTAVARSTYQGRPRLTFAVAGYSIQPRKTTNVAGIGRLF